MPAVDETQVYVYQSDSTAMAYDKITGERAWAVPTHTLGNSGKDCGRGASPLIEGDLAIFGGVALNKRTGEFIYGGCGSSAHNAISSFDYNGRRWLCRRGATYDILTGLSSPLGSVGSSSGRGSMQPTWYGDRFYSVSGIKLIGASAYLWQDGSTYRTQYHIPIAYEGYGYTGYSTQYKGGGGTLKCARLSDGALAWSGPGIASISIAGDKLLLGTGGGIAIAKTGPGGYNTEGRAIFKMETAGPQSFHAGIVPLGQRLYIPAGKYIICLDCAYSAPALENRAGAWDGIAGRAIMRGKFVNTGGRTPVRGYVYWGRVDGGTNAAQWEGCTPLGEMTPGLFENAVADVPVDSVIYYRCYAENSEGGTWAAGPSERISTFSTPCVEGEVELLLHWPLDEESGTTAVDHSGHGNHGRLNQYVKAEAWTNGIMGGAVYFSGAKAGIEAAATGSDVVLNEHWTAGMWIKCEVDGSGEVLHMAEWAPATWGGHKNLGNMCEIIVSSSSGRLTGFGATSTTAVKDGTWHHVTLVRDGSVTRLYVDGVEDRPPWSSQLSRYRWCALGMYGGDFGHAGHFGMSRIAVDDTRIYGRALSLAEIRALAGLAAGNETDGALTMAGGSDDAQESAGGSVTVDGAELDLGVDAGGDPTVTGLRFANVAVPRGATMLGAYLQFAAGDVPAGVRQVLSQGSLAGFAGQDNGGTATVTDGGRSIELAGNTWKAHPIAAYTVTSNTMLAFEFSCASAGEVHGIALEDQTNTVHWGRVFRLYGSERPSGIIRTYEKLYSGGGNVVTYEIPLGTHYTGAVSYLAFVNDDDKSPFDSQSAFGNIRLYERGAGTQADPAALEIFGQAVDNAPAFAAAAFDLSGRTVTRAGVPWLPAPWPAGDCGPAQLTPNLAGIVQELVDRPGWTSGNAVAFLIRACQGQDGRRVADASEKPWGRRATLALRWTDTTDVDGDSIPDAWERTAGAPSLMVPGEDSDGDGAINWHEYLAGTDAGDRESVLKLDIRGLADGRVAVGFQGRATAGPGYEAAQKRCYTLEYRTTLPAGVAGGEEVLWLEDFALPDGTQTDTGETAWTTLPKGTFAVYDGCFKAAGGNAQAEWRSEPIAVMGVPAGFSLDIRSQGNLKQGDYIKVFYSVDDGPETLLAERYDNFNANAWETIGVEGLMGLTVRIVIRARGEHGDDTHYWDNIRVWGVKNTDWPAVPAVSNILVTTDRMIEYTNNAPAKTGFYRLKTKLE